jgi:aminomethyltransferase
VAEGAKILNEDKEEIGIVTSGGPSPTLERNIAMGYVDASYRKSGTKVLIQVRTRSQPATVTKMPFIETKYFK